MKQKLTNAILPLFCSLLAYQTQAAENAAKANVDLNLRYESVSQDNAKKDADALTLRTRVNFQTPSYHSFKAVVEFEDSRVVAGVDDYNNTNGKNSQYSVIADPETTELDQGYLQYQQGALTAKLGRQLLTFDNHRFVGHVGWRQDRQTFDAFTLSYQASDKVQLSYAYLEQRNRIFAEQKDIAAKDHLLNASMKTAYGKLSAYGYLLEMDEGASNALDTYGIRFAGKKGNIPYSMEIATQNSKSAGNDFDALYVNLEAGYVFNGITAKVGYESLGSDDGSYGFSTPLATLHKFNGWSDQFLATPKQGLQDFYASIGGKAFGGKWAVIVHDFTSEESLDGKDDLGAEINALYVKAINKQFKVGVKLASYSAGDSAFGKVDTDKVWLWLTAKF